MCVEFISIAICAPTKVPSLSFTCGQLHLIAGRREICEEAKGSCVCFFGTCGEISQVATPNPVDWSEVSKVRCLACTKHEDHVGAARDSRDLIESRLLSRNAVMASEQASYSKTIRAFWHGKDTCPFHNDSHPTEAVDGSIKEVPRDSAEQQGMPNSLSGLADARAASPTTSIEDPFNTTSGLAASQWAHAPEYTPAQTFRPRPRRPIPIVRPPSSVHSSASMSSKVSSQKAPSERETDKSPPSVTSEGKVDEKPPASDQKTSHEEDWCPPHLRYRKEGLQAGAVMTVS